MALANGYGASVLETGQDVDVVSYFYEDGGADEYCAVGGTVHTVHF